MVEYYVILKRFIGIHIKPSPPIYIEIANTRTRQLSLEQISFPQHHLLLHTC